MAINRKEGLSLAFSQTLYHGDGEIASDSCHGAKQDEDCLILLKISWKNRFYNNKNIKWNAGKGSLIQP